MFAAQFPKSFNYYLDNVVTARQIFSKLYDTLLVMDPVTLEDQPGLANKWTISDDKKTFTFHLNPAAKWSDGKPITSADVVWTYDAVMKKENLTGPWKVMLSRLNRPEAIDERTVKISCKEVHWLNMSYAGGIYVLPKHWWEGKDFNKVNFEFPVVSGPYAVGEVKEPRSLKIVRRKDYWNNASPTIQGVSNFDTIEFRFYRERELAFDSFRNQDFDVFAVYTANRWVSETKGEKFDKYWIAKQGIYNYNPSAFQGFAMNMRRDLFKDKRVRKALAHLLDRNRMNSTIMHNQYKLHQSYYEDLYSTKHPCPNKPIAFDKDKARKLLAEAGWKANAKTGILEKEGKSLKITFLTRDSSSTKFLLIFKEALKDVGIELTIDTKDWSAWSKDMDTYNYDMTWAAWASVPLKDPEPMWHSKFVSTTGNNNVTGFANDKVDALIEKTKQEFDVEKRHALIREIDQVLVDESPYILLWYIDYVRLLYWNKFGTPDQVLGKYQDEEDAQVFWWHDPDSEADLKSAMAAGSALPAPEYKIEFDKTFGTPDAAPALK